MKDFLRDILIDPFTEGDWIGYILSGIMWIITIAIVGVALWLSGWIIDSSFLSLKQKDGIVIDKYYVPAHTQTTYVMSGKVMIPITSYIDDSYEITVEIDKLTDDVCLEYSSWDAVKIGDKLLCEYTNGRI